mgnify:FL=1
MHSEEKQPMRTHLILLCLMLLLSTAQAAPISKSLLQSLDETLEQRENYMSAKEHTLDSLKSLLQRTTDRSQVLSLYQNLYREYYVYKYDSAMTYNEAAIQLAHQWGDDIQEKRGLIQRSELFALGGRYYEGFDNLQNMDVSTLDSTLRFRYHYTNFLLNLYLGEYGDNNTYTDSYLSQRSFHLKEAMNYIEPDNQNSDYYWGEYYTYVENDPEKAKVFYEQQVNSGRSSRTDAMAYFNLSNYYFSKGEQQKGEEYLIQSCMADIKNNVKENMALQILSAYLFQQGKSQVERAERYISISLEDARFYDSRLRIVESSRVFPTIISAYQSLLQDQNKKQQYGLWGITILAIWLLFETFFYIKQNKQLSVKRNELAQSNDNLTMLNEKLGVLNGQLMDTNHRRERLAKLYIDLCADYINKLKSYQSLVRRKIKANQVNDLATTISSTKLSEQDAATFLTQFDKAFLDLYPTFITEFNQLLRPEEQIIIPQERTLSMELRIFALIRLGVKESSEIALLLFLSPQTVYNYRSTVKNKAIDRETFEDEVRQLCTILK